MTEPENPDNPQEEPEEEESHLRPAAGDWQSGVGSGGLHADDLRVELPAFVREDETLSLSPRTQVMIGGGPRPRPQMPLTDAFASPTLAAHSERLSGAQQWSMRLTFFDRTTRITDIFLAVLLAVGAFIAVTLTYRGFGHSWDEALYLKPSQLAMDWVQGVAGGDTNLLSSEGIARHWGERLDSQDPLHPEVAPLPKLVIGAGLRYLPARGFDPMTSMRLPVAVLFGLTVGIIFLLASREYGRAGGFGAALAYAFMPRVFGHAHIAASETLLAFCVVATIYVFLLAIKRWPLSVLTGIFFGLAVATKVTAILLPLPLLLWGQLYRRREYASNVFAMLFLSPLVAVALWPWLWHDSLRKFFSFILFYADHQKTAVYYLQQVWGYNQGPAPWHYPLVILGVSVPEWILLLAGAGLLRAVAQMVTRPVPVLFVLLCVFWIGMSALPAAPKYDGERLFFPVFAPLALLAGGGFSAVFAWMERVRRARRLPASSEVSWAAAASLCILALVGFIDIAVSHPNQLNYFNWIVGRPRGAYEKGFETSYWGEAVNEEVTDYLSKTVKGGQKVKVLALNALAFENLRQWGRLPENADFSPEAPPFDFLVMQVRQGFFGRAERVLHLGRHQPLQTFSAQGVPRIKVFPGNILETATTATVTPPVASAVAPPPAATPAPTPAATLQQDVISSPPVAHEAEQTTRTPLNTGGGMTTTPVTVVTTATLTIPPPVRTNGVSTVPVPVVSETPPASVVPTRTSVYEPVKPRDPVSTTSSGITISVSPPRPR